MEGWHYLDLHGERQELFEDAKAAGLNAGGASGDVPCMRTARLERCELMYLLESSKVCSLLVNTVVNEACADL